MDGRVTVYMRKNGKPCTCAKPYHSGYYNKQVSQTNLYRLEAVSIPQSSDT